MLHFSSFGKIHSQLTSLRVLPERRDLRDVGDVVLLGSGPEQHTVPNPHHVALLVPDGGPALSHQREVVVLPGINGRFILLTSVLK